MDEPRFFEELPEASLKWLTPQVTQGYAAGRRQNEGGWGKEWFRRPEDVPYTGSKPTGGMDKGNGYADSKREAGTGFRIGQQVFHTKFGEGVVVTIEGSGDEARAQVNFGRHGMKWLALSVAKLTPVD